MIFIIPSNLFVYAKPTYGSVNVDTLTQIGRVVQDKFPKTDYSILTKKGYSRIKSITRFEDKQATVTLKCIIDNFKKINIKVPMFSNIYNIDKDTFDAVSCSKGVTTLGVKQLVRNCKGLQIVNQSVYIDSVEIYPPSNIELCKVDVDSDNIVCNNLILFKS